jgi:hypothetical protein
LLLLSCLVELRDLPLECLGNRVLLPGVAAEPNERVWRGALAEEEFGPPFIISK